MSERRSDRLIGGDHAARGDAGRPGDLEPRRRPGERPSAGRRSRRRARPQRVSAGIAKSSTITNPPEWPEPERSARQAEPCRSDAADRRPRDPAGPAPPRERVAKRDSKPTLTPNRAGADQLWQEIELGTVPIVDAPRSEGRWQDARSRGRGSPGVFPGERKAGARAARRPSGRRLPPSGSGCR